MTDVFISYSHKDVAILERLMVHLRPLLRQRTVEVFSDQDIRADEHWRNRIRGAIESSKVGILLVSADFLGSSFIADEELPLLFRGRHQGKKRLLTVFVAPSSYDLVPEIADYQAVNAPDRPISRLSHHEAEEVYLAVAKEVGASLVVSNALSEAKGDLPERRDYPELDYDLLATTRSFRNVAINIPKVIVVARTAVFEGYHFEECKFVGPAIVLVSGCLIDGPSIYSPVDYENRDALIVTPKSGDQVVGAFVFQHCHLLGCSFELIGFADHDGYFAARMNEAKVISDDALP